MIKKLVWTGLVGYVAYLGGYFHALIEQGKEEG